MPNPVLSPLRRVNVCRAFAHEAISYGTFRQKKVGDMARSPADFKANIAYF